MGSIPESERSPGEGNGKPFQYSCLRNPMDDGAWQATEHGVAKELGLTQQTNKNNLIVILNINLVLFCRYFFPFFFFCSFFL